MLNWLIQHRDGVTNVIASGFVLVGAINSYHPNAVDSSFDILGFASYLMGAAAMFFIGKKPQ